MSVLDMLLGAKGQGSVEQIGKSFGLEPAAVKQIVGQLVPALTGAVGRNAGSPDGLGQLVGALSRGGHDQYLDRPDAVTQPEGLEDGKRILGHLLGSKDASRKLAQQAAAASGIDATVIKQVLPAVAALTMGALSKQTAGGRGLASGEGPSTLMALLDRNKDGQVLDDVLNLAKKFF